MKKFLLEIKKTGSKVVLGYRDGMLVYVEMKECVSKLQVMWIWEKVPLPYEELANFIKYTANKGVVISEMIPDLSFAFFWNTYGYKKGKKPTVKRVWDSMDTTDQSKALAYLKKYNYYLAENSHVPKLYPQTYLNRKEWNN